MSRTVLRTINMTLDKKSIEDAIKAVRQFREDLRTAMDKLVKDLAKKGCDVARANILLCDAIETGRLMDSVRYDPNVTEGLARIMVTSEYAIYVEYGTGIVGRDAPHPGRDDPDWNNPPYPSYNGNTYTDYDSQGHGTAGWVYPKGTQLRWTMGIESRPFLYNTLWDLVDIAQEQGITIIAKQLEELEK